MSANATIVLPQAQKIIAGETASYWAAFYGSILKAIRFQKNIEYPWNEHRSLQEYKGELRVSGFFEKMQSTVRNHAFEYVIEDFLKTEIGLTYFKKLCGGMLADYQLSDFEVKLMNIFKVGTDSETNYAIRNYRRNSLMMLLPKGIKAMPNDKLEGYNLYDTLKYSDIFIIISNGERTIGFVGEVEANHGERLYNSSYYRGQKNKYCTFGISVSDKKKHGDNSIKGEITLNRSEGTDKWILNFSKSNFFIKDYFHAVENMKNLIDGHFGYLDAIEDSGHQKILEIIKSGWKKDIDDVISMLRDLIEFVFPGHIFHYEETLEGKSFYRPSSLILPGELPLYSIENESTEDSATPVIFIPSAP